MASAKVASEVRVRLPVEERREQLLNLGQELFSRRAFADISVDEIADAAHISKGLLYHYFPSKRELYLACVERASRALVAASEPSAVLPPPARLRASLEGFIDYVERNLLSFATLLQGGESGDADVDRILSQMRRSVIDRCACDLGVPNPSASTRMCLLGYVGFTSYTCMAWAKSPQLDREGLRLMLENALLSTVATAAELSRGNERAALRKSLEQLRPQR